VRTDYRAADSDVLVLVLSAGGWQLLLGDADLCVNRDRREPAMRAEQPLLGLAAPAAAAQR
jgi:hypothetical protein